MTEIIKESKVLGKLVMREIDYDLAKKIIIENHYSHKWNTAFGKINIGILQDNVVYGVASFGNLMNPNSYKNISASFEKDNVIELNRLWISDYLGKNAETILLGACWTLIKNNHPEVKAIQSFADGRLGCGTIYKAASFKYYGYEKSLFYENTETGETQHKVPMENTMRPNGFIKLNREFCEGKLRPFYVKTYRYIFPLYKNVKIDLKECEYPKYEKGSENVENYQHSINLLARALILAKVLKQDDDVKIIEKYIFDNFNVNEIYEILTSSLENKSIKRIVDDRCLENNFIEVKNYIFNLFF